MDKMYYQTFFSVQTDGVLTSKKTSGKTKKNCMTELNKNII